MTNILTYFESLLEERFKIDKNISEDTIRYLFFSSAILSDSAKPNDIFLEYPHPQIEKAKIDTYINFKNEKQDWVIEFKFDREIPSGLASFFWRKTIIWPFILDKHRKCYFC